MTVLGKNSDFGEKVVIAFDTIGTNPSKFGQILYWGSIFMGLINDW